MLQDKKNMFFFAPIYLLTKKTERLSKHSYSKSK